MYGMDGGMNALQWLALTGDPKDLRPEDQKRWGLRPVANNNRAPSSNADDAPPKEP